MSRAVHRVKQERQQTKHVKAVEPCTVWQEEMMSTKFKTLDRVIIVADYHPQDGSWYVGEPGTLVVIDPDDNPLFIVIFDYWWQYSHTSALCFNEEELHKITPADYLF